MIKITFPDGNVKEFAKGTTAYQIAESISPRLAADSLAASVNGATVDLNRPAIENGLHYAVDSPAPITEADLETIEKKMIELSRNKEQLIRTEVSKADALKNFTEKGDPYKVELIRDL